MTYNNRHHNNRSRPRNFGGVPDRWMNYDPVGREIEGTRFVPFKTPLHTRIFQGSNIHPDNHFDVHTILQFARQAGHRIGMVIDLTNTDRYYDKSLWAQNDVIYRKINCPGHTVNTREDIVETFVEMVDDYINTHPDDSLIGVHCTHGLNRTGYLICRYLIDRQGWTAAKAISQFEYNRGHPIERGPYKKSLYEAEDKLNLTKSETITTETDEIIQEGEKKDEEIERKDEKAENCTEDDKELIKDDQIEVLVEKPSIDD